jgi:putative PEP-CTERM system histidine kinase
MSWLLLVDVISALFGLALTVSVCIAPRFGPGSWLLAAFLIPASASAAIVAAGPRLWSQEWSAALSFACLVFCAAGGCLNSYTIKRPDYLSLLKKKRAYLLVTTVIAPVIIVSIHLRQFWLAGLTNVGEMFALGPAGHYGAIYLLLVSVVALGNIEQAIRGAEEHIRWEIKFLLLGMASILGAIVYLASTILLYSPVYAFLSTNLLRIFPIILLLACALMFQSWRRGNEATPIVVSQSVIYSTITLVSVGAYLIVSALAARWVSRWGQTGVPIEPVVFIVSLIVLSTILLGTAFRHRVKHWIRRNVFAGQYDYRAFWMDATERVRSTDSTGVAGAALAELIEKALGSLDISVWAKDRRSGTLRLTAARGTIVGNLPEEIFDVAERFVGITEPVSVKDKIALEQPVANFLEHSKASLLVPLVSSGNIVGVLTVGADRSGKPFDWETREFLRVMAVHLANELHKAELLATLVETREAEAFRMFSTFLLHDLKNFASTLSLISKNASRLHGNPNFQKDAFQSVFEISNKMKRLCNSLRSFSSNLAGNKTFENVNEIVRSVAESFQNTVGRPVLLSCDPVPKIPLDREEIVRVLQNLVLNAHEASVDPAAIRITTTYSQQSIVVSVADKGIGMSPEFIHAGIFQPFQTTKPEGLGIGLFQSKKIVEAHGGTIEVESAKGRGTVVRIILPIQETAAAAAAAGVHEPSTHLFGAGKTV